MPAAPGSLCPRGLFRFGVGTRRWTLRVQAHIYLMRDEYPPFSLSADAGAPSREMYMLSSIAGWLVAAALVAAGVVLSRETVRVDVRYADLRDRG